MGRFLPHLRAAFVLFHLAAITLQALPHPGGGMRRSAWSDPTVRDELGAWASRLRRAGIDLGATDEEIEASLWTVAGVVTRARQAALRPFAPYARWCGTSQPWRMFVAPHRYPTRLHVDVLEPDGWRTIFVERSSEHTWSRHRFDHDRTRAAVFRYGWRAYRSTYDQLVDWIALRAAEDFPEAGAVRVRFWKARTPSAAEVRAGVEPEGAWVQPRVRRFDR